jgi:hypothetical protein
MRQPGGNASSLRSGVAQQASRIGSELDPMQA